MPKGFYRDIAKWLAESGFRKTGNAKGSHEKWQHPETGRILIVPRNLMSRHTANGILKDAGSDRKL